MFIAQLEIVYLHIICAISGIKFTNMDIERVDSTVSFTHSDDILMAVAVRVHEFVWTSTMFAASAFISCLRCCYAVVVANNVFLLLINSWISNFNQKTVCSLFYKYYIFESVPGEYMFLHSSKWAVMQKFDSLRICLWERKSLHFSMHAKQRQ